MAIWDVRANGTSLMSMNYGVDTFVGRRVIPQRRTPSVVVPGVPGNDVFWGEFDPSVFSISGWVEAAAPGKHPTPEGLEANLDKLLRLFIPRKHVTITWIGPSGLPRTAYAKVTSAITPDIEHNALRARFTVAFENPDCFWIGNQFTFTTTVMGSYVPITQMASVTGVDAKPTVRLWGPATNPSITIGDFQCTYSGTVPSGGYIEYNSANLRCQDHLGQGIAPKVSQTKPVFFQIEPGASVFVQGAGAGAKLEIHGRTMYS